MVVVLTEKEAEAVDLAVAERLMFLADRDGNRRKSRAAAAHERVTASALDKVRGARRGAA